MIHSVKRKNPFCEIMLTEGGKQTKKLYKYNDCIQTDKD